MLMSSGNTVTNVTAGKPNTTGAVYRAPITATIPTDPTTALSADYVCLGFCSDDGVTNSGNMESENIKAWGGDTVLVIQTSKDDTFSFSLIEALSVDVLKTVYGENNVTGDLTTGVSINVSNADVEEKAYVFDMVLRGNVKKRIVIPAAKISAIEDIVYSDSAAIGYAITTDCTPDASGNTHYEYIKKP